jgi:hypothetical protein
MASSDEKIRETQRLLGQATIALSSLDTLLERLFMQFTMLEHEMASTIYLATDGIGRRRQLADAVAKIALKDPAMLAEWSSIATEHAEVFRERNRLLHDTWALNPEDGTFLLLRQIVPNKGYKSADIMRTIKDDDLVHLAQRAASLVQRMIKLSIGFYESTKPKED